MKRYTVHLADEAWGPIQAQVRYIAIDNNAPQNAEGWLLRLLEAIDSLEQMPQRNPLDPHQSRIHGEKVHRMIFERTYLAFYIIDERRSRVDVVSFRHGAKDSK